MKQNTLAVIGLLHKPIKKSPAGRTACLYGALR